jgi:hypothetical protein
MITIISNRPCGLVLGSSLFQPMTEWSENMIHSEVSTERRCFYRRNFEVKRCGQTLELGSALRHSSNAFCPLNVRVELHRMHGNDVQTTKLLCPLLKRQGHVRRKGKQFEITMFEMTKFEITKFESNLMCHSLNLI